MSIPSRSLSPPADGPCRLPPRTFAPTLKTFLLALNCGWLACILIHCCHSALETLTVLRFDPVSAAWDNLHFGTLMKPHCNIARGLFLAGLAFGALTPSRVAAQADASKSNPPRAAESPDLESKRAETYYNYTMGHIAEQMYESTSRSEYATQAIDFYKKAYALDPSSPVIGERLAEMYWKAQRLNEAVLEAQQLLKRDPNNLPTRRLLGRIYLRSLGGVGATGTNGSAGKETGSQEIPSGQAEIIKGAIEQYREICRLDPSDSESALWLARLYRLQNSHQKAEEVLRGVLKTDPQNQQAIEQLTQLLLDEGKSAAAVALLEGIVQRGRPSASLLSLLGDAYTQAKDLAKAEKVYRQRSEEHTSELQSLAYLVCRLLLEKKKNNNKQC